MVWASGQDYFQIVSEISQDVGLWADIGLSGLETLWSPPGRTGGSVWREVWESRLGLLDVTLPPVVVKKIDKWMALLMRLR